MRELTGRTALVTGGSRGLGRACCKLLAEAGANVAVNFQNNADAAAETVALVNAAGATGLAVQADVAEQHDVEEMVTAVTEQLGPIDLLVNNAGVFDFVSHDETTPEIWQRTLDVNLTGAYFTTWAVKESMLERGFGRIVNVTSIGGLRARPMSIAYTVSKAGMIALTKSIAEAVAANNIRVNAVAPGLMETDMTEINPPEQQKKLIEATPMQRIGRPEEVGEVVLFLLSERSSFMTGQTVVASGGRVTLP